MKIGIYSPYFSIFGGGEKYILTIAQTLSQKHSVTLFADPGIQAKALNTFNINLEKVVFDSEAEFLNASTIHRYLKGRDFDIFFYMTDGSLFYPSAGKNFLLIQSPVHCPSFSLSNRIKLQNWNLVCYSKFMADIVEKKLKRKAHILSPCIETFPEKKTKKSKEKIILTVGRFFPAPHSKKHDILVHAFQKLSKDIGSGWKFVIIGGLTELGGNDVYQNLKKLAGNLPVEILTNISYSQLSSFYMRATLYWHATGYGEDLNLHSERAEHFGITTLEAMSYGTIPLVFDGGGQKDIVTNGINGYVWNTTDELCEETIQVITNKALQDKLSQRALKRAENFSCKTFDEKLETLF